MLDTLTIDSFKPLLNQPFQIQVSEEQTVEMELVDVSGLPTEKRPVYGFQKAAETGQRESFALVFCMPPEIERLGQAMYSVSHAELGELGAIFLVAITQDTAGIYYEAIFT